VVRGFQITHTPLYPGLPSNAQVTERHRITDLPGTAEFGDIQVHIGTLTRLECPGQVKSAVGEPKVTPKNGQRFHPCADAFWIVLASPGDTCARVLSGSELSSSRATTARERENASVGMQEFTLTEPVRRSNSDGRFTGGSSGAERPIRPPQSALSRLSLPVPCP
jgi:hypothetical protein